MFITYLSEWINDFTHMENLEIQFSKHHALYKQQYNYNGIWHLSHNRIRTATRFCTRLYDSARDGEDHGLRWVVDRA